MAGYFFRMIEDNNNHTKFNINMDYAVNMFFAAAKNKSRRKCLKKIYYDDWLCMFQDISPTTHLLITKKKEKTKQNKYNCYT